ncbi:hypothetical protein HHI36_009534 [Cryptolaemus montrouzieri]|uniref:Uncharacterized protein n=1 Tax=Cryptolaemus montrouzieri TaxID=559131 RepID=A0ABD2MG00_9CUCU
MSILTGSLGSINEVPLEVKLSKFFEDEAGDIIVMEICEELLETVMDTIQTKTLEHRAQQLVVECAMEAIKKAVEINGYFHNVSYSNMEKGSWEPDIICEPSEPDSWAAYKAPLSYDKKEKGVNLESTRESNSAEDKSVKDNLKIIHDSSQGKLSATSSSQDNVSITDYLEDLSTSSEEEEEEEEPHPPSWVNMSPMERMSQESVKQSSKISSKLSAKLSQLSGRSFTDDEGHRKTERERYLSSIFSKTALGDTEKGLCVPHVANIPANNVIKEVPELEQFTFVRVDKRKIKVSKKQKVMPRRRSDTKLKMTEVVEDPAKDKGREKRKL